MRSSHQLSEIMKGLVVAVVILLSSNLAASREISVLFLIFLRRLVLDFASASKNDALQKVAPFDGCGSSH